jgi:DNA polymerase III subunit delta
MPEKPNIYLIYGDEYLVKEQTKKVVAQFLSPEESSTNLTVFDGAGLDAASLETELFTPSLFGGNRVLLVEQTSVFMSRTNEGKLLAKALDAWKSGQSKPALRSFAQFLGVAGMGLNDLADPKWVEEAAPDLSPESKDAASKLAEAFIHSGQNISQNDDKVIQSILEETLPADTALIFNSTDIDKKKKLVKLFEKKGRLVPCVAQIQKYAAGLDRDFFADQVNESLSVHKKRMTPRGMERLYSRAGADMRTLKGELEKLITYVGNRAEITDQDVDAVILDLHAPTFFELTNVLRTRNLAKCLSALHENLKMVDHPLQTLASIMADVRKLLIARELLFTAFAGYWQKGMRYNDFVKILPEVKSARPELLGKGKFKLLSLKDYPLYLLLKDVEMFPMKDLTRIMEAGLEADIMMKSTRVGGRSPELIMERLVYEICSHKN